MVLPSGFYLKIGKEGFGRLILEGATGIILNKSRDLTHPARIRSDDPVRQDHVARISSQERPALTPQCITGRTGIAA
jgi:hypothetical protein